MKVMYRGSKPLKIRLSTKEFIKINQDDIIEIPELDWNAVSLSGNFEVVEFVGDISGIGEIEKVEEKKPIKKKKKGGK